MVGYLSKKPKTFLWMIQENFTGKGDVQHKLEGPSKSPRESPPPSQDAGRPFKSRGGWTQCCKGSIGLNASLDPFNTIPDRLDWFS
jgi:hypothetical protein